MRFWPFGKQGDKSSIDNLRPSVGANRRVYAIGDIHGRLDLLEELLRLIVLDYRARGRTAFRLVLLGDLIDRGTASRDIVERVMSMMTDGKAVQCVKGNHEELFVLAARGDARILPTFRRAGGAQTLASYGLDPALFDSMTDAEVADWMLNHVPREHVDFLDDLPDSVTFGDYLFVHAGIRPGVPIARQKPADLRWIRHLFLDHEGAHPMMIVHGHSITPDVDERSNRIGIDTGAYFSGRLTAIGLEGTDRWFLQTGS